MQFADFLLHHMLCTLARESLQVPICCRFSISIGVLDPVVVHSLWSSRTSSKCTWCGCQRDSQNIEIECKTLKCKMLVSGICRL